METTEFIPTNAELQDSIVLLTKTLVVQRERIEQLEARAGHLPVNKKRLERARLRSFEQLVALSIENIGRAVDRLIAVMKPKEGSDAE